MTLNIAPKNWHRRTIYALALYAIISVSIGAEIDSGSAATDYTPLSPSYVEPVVQVYAARTWGNKGKLAVHTWIVTKAQNADYFQRYEIVGWQLRWSDSALRSSRWYGLEKPQW